jgi:hypothetical protein
LAVIVIVVSFVVTDDDVAIAVVSMVDVAVGVFVVVVTVVVVSLVDIVDRFVKGASSVVSVEDPFVVNETEIN